MTPARRRWLVGCGLLLIAQRILLAGQQIRWFWDSEAYLEQARQPFDWSQIYYPKPILPSLVYRLCGVDQGWIVMLQEWLSLFTWLVFGAALLAWFRSPRARLACGIAVVLLVLDPFRIGFCDVLLSESLNDSLMALLLASLLVAFARTGAVRAWATAAAAVIGIAWLFARDTNAVVAIVAIATALIVWRGALLRRYAVIAIMAVVAATSVFVLSTTTVVPAPTHLSFQSIMPPDFTARMTYSMMDNLVSRVLPDREAREFFVAHGLPQVDKLVAIDPEHGRNRQAIYRDPAFDPARIWIETSFRSVWIEWLALHPLARVGDQLRHAGELLGVAKDDYLGYMPVGWHTRGAFGKKLQLASYDVVVLLVLLFVPALYRRRREPLGKLAICLVVSGWVGGLSAFYGDSAEVGRHCYGAGQQVFVAIVLVLLLAIERLSPSAPPSPPA